MEMEMQTKEILELVGELTERYTSKESTSVTYETAQQLMGAVLYCIEENEKGSSGTELLQGQSSIRRIYEAGYEKVLQKVEQARILYNELAVDFEDYGSRALRETFDAIPQFFIRYDARFSPQNHILTLDYPVLYSQENLCGIDRIYAWLHCIRAEQEFLRSFSGEFVRKVLEKFHPDYEELFENLGEILLRKVVANRMLGLPSDWEILKEEDYQKLIQLFGELEKQEAEQKIYEILEGQCESEEQLLYVSGAIPNLAVGFLNMAETGNMEVFV